jgi:CBS domain-containing protein
MNESTLMNRRRSLSELRVMRAMHPGVLACAPDALVGRVAELMAAYGIHAVVVFRRDADGDSAPWGVISDLDLVGALLDGVGEDATASSIAASPVVLVSTDDTLEHAAERMIAHGTSHLVVLDADTSHPVGILSTLDIAAAVAQLPVRSGPPRRRRRMTI